MIETDQKYWYPIAASSDLPYRHTFHGQLLGREFAVWRADDGYVNVWENRCLHRGVRLSIGINDGRELKCQYHGWRYANRTAGCTYIPAHPADAPARTICNRTYPSIERYGFVWSGEEPEGELPIVEELEGGVIFQLRAIPVNASASLVSEYLKEYQFQPNARITGKSAQTTVKKSSKFEVHLIASEGAVKTEVVFFVQLVDSNRSVIRGVLCNEPSAKESASVLIHHNQRLSALRKRIEQKAESMPILEPLQPIIKPVSEELSVLPIETKTGRSAALRVQVAKKWSVAKSVLGFKLTPISGQVPTFQAGAHIDVHMPNGIIRQYSLTNGPGETQSYTIGVKLEPDSKGGSKCMHEDVREGDVLAISAPRNNFPLRRDSIKTIFIAGGIGITPLLSMAQTLNHSNMSYELHYFAQSEEHMAFPKVRAVLGDSVIPHLALNPDQTGKMLSKLLDNYEPAMHVYVCGPGPMLEATRAIASKLGWPEDAVHFEYFKNTNEIDDSSSFEIALSRSAVTLQVPAGKSILEVMRENGIDVPSSCEQGACGTCLTTVLEGEPDHQDVYLSNTEKQKGDCVMTCVSRAKSKRLVLDI